MLTTRAVARRVGLIERAMGPFFREMTQSRYARRPPDRPAADFVAGNPQEMTLPGFVAALTRWSVPLNKDWFAYKMMDRAAQEAAARSVSARLGIAFEPDDVILARGAMGGLALAMQAILDPGDEVIFVSPPWFFYEAMILAANATPVRVKVDPITFDLDVDAIARAITERTRAVIVNTPHNPTGKIYPPATLQRLGQALSEASARHDRPIYVLSDEAYSRILFDGNPFYTPARWYPHTFAIHTYSKSALAPGQRLGFVALPPTMPDRETVRFALLAGGLASGVGMPDAVMQYALPEIDALSIDLGHLQRKRNRLVAALREQGYDLQVPQGTFYLLPRSPIPDDRRFVDWLAERDVYVLPGQTVELPGYFRVSLTANDEMIDRALPVFAAAIREFKE
jgi:aspartate aminotransferase